MYAAFGEAIGPVGLGKTYGISYAASASLIEGLLKANSGDLTSLQDLGLTRNDVENLVNLKMPSEESIDQVAENLDASSEELHTLLQTVITATQAANPVTDPRSEGTKKP